MTLVAFKLSMPSNNSWNGRWSGEGNLYAIVKNLPPKKAAELDDKYFHYNFGDGWAAFITSSILPQREANMLRKQSKGFCGYEWMVTSIIAHGEIRA